MLQEGVSLPMAEATICMMELQVVHFTNSWVKTENCGIIMVKILGTTMENLTAWVTRCLGLIDPWLKLPSYTKQGDMYKTDCDYCIKIIHEENLPDA
jgi:hypothetical protein